ncbi:MAG: WXG100 family type VII secretion target [Anaerolineae bacterium]|nr:WXG100 family type VII secretion target [Anaerolineae bacterium]
MTHDLIQVNYPDLLKTAEYFKYQNQRFSEFLIKLKTSYEALRSGGWMGEGADEFFEEMESSFFPRFQRMMQALGETDHAIRQIHDIFQEAEEQAVAQFHGTTNNVITDTTGSSTPALFLSPIDRGNGYTLIQYSEGESLEEILDRIFTRDDDTMTRYFNTLDESAIVAQRLQAAVDEGRIHPDTLNALIAAAQNGDEGAIAALYALAFVDAQAFEDEERENNWQEFENKSGFVYMGSNGGYADQSPLPIGGNCTMFVSAALFMAGLTRFESSFNANSDWNLGWVETYGSPNFPITAFITGSDAFRTVGDLNLNLDYRSNEQQGTFSYTQTSYEWGEYDTIPNTLGPGDLVFTYHDNNGSTAPQNHVAMVVGWAPPDYDYAQNGQPPLFTTQADAQAYYGETVVPWTVDHGGNGPVDHPRPFDDASTYEMTNNPERRVFFGDLDFQGNTITPPPAPTITPTPSV